MKRLAPILLAPLALLALGAALTPGDGSLPMALDESSPRDTITTDLHPGWNTAAWLGPDAPVPELFDAIPALRRWLRLGLSGYAEYTYLAAAGPETLETVRSRLARTARRVELPLSSLETYTSGTTPRVEVLTPLSYFAVDWLAQRAGEQSLLEYLRQRSSSEPWQDTFEAVFGISVDNFYEEFEAYRAEVAPLAR